MEDQSRTQSSFAYQYHKRSGNFCAGAVPAILTGEQARTSAVPPHRHFAGGLSVSLLRFLHQEVICHKSRGKLFKIRSRSIISLFLKEKKYSPVIFLAFSVLGLMVVVSGEVIFPLTMFGFIQFTGSLHFGAVGLNAAHHHPDIFHDGDTPR